MSRKRILLLFVSLMLIVGMTSLRVAGASSVGNALASACKSDNILVEDYGNIILVKYKPDIVIDGVPVFLINESERPRIGISHDKCIWDTAMKLWNNDFDVVFAKDINGIVIDSASDNLIVTTLNITESDISRVQSQLGNKYDTIVLVDVMKINDKICDNPNLGERLMNDRRVNESLIYIDCTPPIVAFSWDIVDKFSVGELVNIVTSDLGTNNYILFIINGDIQPIIPLDPNSDQVAEHEGSPETSGNTTNYSYIYAATIVVLAALLGYTIRKH